jgi:hypothetical protein
MAKEPRNRIDQHKTPRRAFLKWVTGLCGALAAAVTAVPIVGYLAGAMRKTKPA